jgi:hypothetical protein
MRALEAIEAGIKPKDYHCLVDLEMFTSPKACSSLLTWLNQNQCFNIMLVEGMVLLDKLPPDERSKWTNLWYTDMVQGKYPMMMQGTHAPTAFYVASAMAVYPYPTAREDIWRLLQQKFETTFVDDYIALCFKDQKRIPTDRIKHILEAKAGATNMRDTTYAYLVELAEDPVEAQRLIRSICPDLASDAFSRAVCSTLGAWVKANYSRILIN